ncbi:MAG TPA: DUF2785 domain-containing protein [Steroidobacteraceae bacterium]
MTRIGITLLLLAATPAAIAATSPAASETAHGRAFWMQLLQECKVPKGESAAALVDEAVSFQASRESFWRDDVGYQVVVQCVYRQRRLAPDERRKLVDALAVNLRRGVGESGTDTVFLRSFSALDLSVIQALELQDPVLDVAGFRGLVDAALAYLLQEKDGRGFEPEVGWIHATAHTADLLKYLARDPRFAPTDQARLLDAAWRKATAAETPGWDFGEDERLASALLSVTRRADFDGAAFDEWLARFLPLEKNYRNLEAPDLDAIEATRNARDLLQSLYVQLSLEQPSPTAGQQAARSRVLETLRLIRR